MRDTVVIHSSEICLKGGNRGYFEKRLVANIADRLAPIGAFRILRRQGSFLAQHDGPLSDSQTAAIRTAFGSIFGIGTFAIAARCKKTREDISRACAELLAEEGPTTFKVFARRGDKTFPMNSEELAREVGGDLLEAVPHVTVDVHEPKTRIDIEIPMGDEALVAVGRASGPGGLPSGTSGRVVSLLSGGIDSPVASWKLMRRGCEAVFVHFHSYPYTGRESIEKVQRLAQTLAEYQGGASLWLVPLADVQQEIVAKADPAMRVILYRRAMLRIAAQIAHRVNAKALVTGDSVGQVASQTLENIETVSAATMLPIFRPLVGENKNDIVAAARAINTFATSIEPHEDCCSIFMPPRAATRSTIALAEAEEAKCDLAPRMAAALAAAEQKELRPTFALAATAHA